MQTHAQPKLCTPAEYFLLEEAAEERSEYRNGEMVPMAGGTANHNRIAGEFYKRFPTEISGEAYESFIGNMKLWIPEFSLYTYPDVLVIQGDPVYHQNRTDTVENPHLIMEVLSKSTRQYDQTDKFDAYRSLPSLQEYVMADQYSFWVKQFAKNDQGKWVLTELAGEEAVLQLTTVTFELPLADLYKRANFEEESG